MGIAEVVYCALCMVLCTIPAKFIAYTTLEYTCTGVVYFYVREVSKRTNVMKYDKLLRFLRFRQICNDFSSAVRQRII